LTTYEVVVKGRDNVAEGTMAFRLSKPPGFHFTAGQAVDLALIDPPAQANSTHRLLSLRGGARGYDSHARWQRL
jgi:ferredoxin-NADP reductase